MNSLADRVFLGLAFAQRYFAFSSFGNARKNIVQLLDPRLCLEFAIELASRNESMSVADQRIEHRVVVGFAIHHVDSGLRCVQLIGRLPDLLFPPLALNAALFWATDPRLEGRN